LERADACFETKIYCWTYNWSLNFFWSHFVFHCTLKIIDVSKISPYFFLSGDQNLLQKMQIYFSIFNSFRIPFHDEFYSKLRSEVVTRYSKLEKLKLWTAAFYKVANSPNSWFLKWTLNFFQLSHFRLISLYRCAF